jgi:hypothetical protein
MERLARNTSMRASGISPQWLERSPGDAMSAVVDRIGWTPN